MTELPSSTYTWSLDTSKAEEHTHKKGGKYFKSPMFRMHSFKWHLEFYPNFANTQYLGCYIFLHLLPPNISKFVVQRKIYIDLLETTNTSIHEFSNGFMNWGTDTLLKLTEAIETMKKFTIKVTLTLTDVFDCNGKDITEQYINQTEQKSQAPVATNDDKYQEYEERLNSLTTQMDQMMKNMTRMQNTLKDIQLQMNEEQKNDNKDLKKEVEEIKNNMKILLLNNKNNDNEMDQDKKKFKNWIEVILKLPQYYDVFIKNGVETLTVVKLLTKDELNEMGITKIGHKVQILEEIQKFKKQSEKQPQEGGTAYI